MAHAEWCGKPCCDCEDPCWLDESMPCSPSCENLGPDGEPLDWRKCKADGCDAYIWEEWEDKRTLQICAKTNKAFVEPFIDYLGFYDPNSKDPEPYRHIDAEQIEYTKTDSGFRAKLYGLYDIWTQKPVSLADVLTMKLMYVKVEDDYPDEDFNIENVYVDWMEDEDDE